MMLDEYTNAGQSLSQSLRLSPSDPDVWNLLGMAYARTRRAQDSADAFRYALGRQANHAPATFNLAVLTEQQLGDDRAAIELYRRYLALNPGATNAVEVRQAIAQLEAVIAMAQRPPSQTNINEQVAQALPTNVVERTNALTSAPPQRSEVVRSGPPPRQDLPVAPDEPQAASPKQTNTTEVVELAPEPELVVADGGSARPATTVSVRADSRLSPTPPPRAKPPEEEPEKKGFFSRVNPLNLFKGEKEDEVKTTKLPERKPNRADSTSQGQLTNASPEARPVVAEPDPVTSASYQRYVYRVTNPPLPGDRPQATRAFQQAQELRKAGRSLEAMQSYLSAVGADPTYFEAQFNLGLLALQRQETELALKAYETATLLQPEATLARYNLALALWQAGYPVDAANELASVLKSDPEEIRAFLTLGNLYAQAFGQPDQARPFYQKVLELDPQHPQGPAITSWLKANPDKQ
jgi:tetratricopeptide (TPR) repeat protein